MSMRCSRVKGLNASNRMSCTFTRRAIGWLRRRSCEFSPILEFSKTRRSPNMKASVIIRSKDEADRLRLTLVSLACQSEAPEVVVVNDGSRDHTVQVIAAASDELDL